MSTALLLAEGNLVSVNPGLAFWTLVTFLVVATVLRWKVWGPLMHVIEEREKGIQNSIDAAKKEREQAEKLLAEQQLAIAAAKKEAADMVRKSQTEVEKAKEELFAKAKAEADAFLAQARKTIHDEKVKALAEVRGIAVELAIAAAAKLIEKKMDDATQRQIADEYVAGLQTNAAAKKALSA